jgi:hypothetical protein
MPYERNPTQNKPLVPRVANAPKSPLTPRIAAHHLRSAQSPSLSVATPRSDLSRNAIISPKLKEDLNTPVKTLLENVTPRSSQRRSRIGAFNSQTSPEQTPTQASTQDASSKLRQAQTNSVQSRPGSVILDGSGVNGPSFSKPYVGSPAASPVIASPREMNAPSFFLASDVKRNEPNLQPNKSSTFFYANGQREETPNRAPSPSLSTVSARSHKSQFYRADGTLDDDERPPHPTSPLIKRSPEIPQSRPMSGINAFPFRPPSPQKMNLHLTYRKGASQIMSPSTRSQTTPNLSHCAAPRSPSPKRRPKLSQSNQPQSPKSHMRAGSLGSIDSSPASRKSSLNVLNVTLKQPTHARGEVTISAPLSARIPPSPQQFSSPSDQDANLTGKNQKEPSRAGISSPQSPIQPISKGFAEAAANARRERKVLDLEISNSSLLAINRQLEREVRRQKSELRRFRRLSRAGRLTSIGSMLLTEEEGELDETTRSIGGLDDEPSDSDNDDDPDSSMSDESLASSSISGSVNSKKDAARLEKDERRLQLDLTKHRQLLVDSQRMNQSLKRCMTLSEEMIDEARKALEYKVWLALAILGASQMTDKIRSTSQIFKWVVEYYNTMMFIVALHQMEMRETPPNSRMIVIEEHYLELGHHLKVSHP